MDLRNHPDVLEPMPVPAEGRTPNDVDQEFLQRAQDHLFPVARARGASSVPTEIMDGWHRGAVGGVQLGTSITIKVVGRQGHRIQVVLGEVQELRQMVSADRLVLFLLAVGFVCLAAIVAGAVLAVIFGSVVR